MDTHTKGKDGHHWQPISKLPLFMSMIQKMYDDTLFKISLLKQGISHPHTAYDKDLANIMHILHRQRKNYPILLRQFELWRSQIQRLDEITLLDKAVICCKKTEAITKECQQVAEKVKNITVEAKSEFLRYDRVTEENVFQERPCPLDYTITDELVKKYTQIRKILGDLYPKFFGCLDKETIERSAKRLEISQGNGLLINTEHESNLFLDYCIYQNSHQGLTAIQRSFNKFGSLYEDDKERFKVFEIASQGYFAYLEILDFADDTGLIVYDRLRNTWHLMMDNGLNKVAKSLYYYTIVTHVMDFDEFLVTTGASTPVSVHTEEGLKVQRRFEDYLRIVQKGKDSLQEKKQCITDLYKICLHEDITGKVTSPMVPFGKEELKKRIHSSAMVH